MTQRYVISSRRREISYAVGAVGAVSPSSFFSSPCGFTSPVGAVGSTGAPAGSCPSSTGLTGAFGSTTGLFVSSTKNHPLCPARIPYNLLRGQYFFGYYKYMLRKILAVGFGIVGLMLIFAGVGLVTLTQQFLLYLGIFILLLSVFAYFKG